LPQPLALLTPGNHGVGWMNGKYVWIDRCVTVIVSPRKRSLESKQGAPVNLLPVPVFPLRPSKE
jgi:hypothetical protein